MLLIMIFRAVIFNRNYIRFELAQKYHECGGGDVVIHVEGREGGEGGQKWIASNFHVFPIHSPPRWRGKKRHSYGTSRFNAQLCEVFSTISTIITRARIQFHCAHTFTEISCMDMRKWLYNVSVIQALCIIPCERMKNQSVYTLVNRICWLSLAVAFN